jgi:hypothetical protein
MANGQSGQLRLQVSDVTGQKIYLAEGVQADTTVDELLRQLVPELRMPRTDVAGRPLAYQLRHDGEGRHLHSAERIGDAVQSDAQVTILPNIDAGASSA